MLPADCRKRDVMGVTAVVSFRDLEVWQAALELAVTAHELTRPLPAAYRFELGSQMRRAATSVPSNVAEGHANRSTRVFLRHVRIAIGSLAEVDTLLEVLIRVALTSDYNVETARSQIVRTRQLLHGLERALRRRVNRTAASIGTTLSLLLATGAWWLGAL
jgi:four helix bundle protein